MDRQEAVTPRRRQILIGTLVLVGVQALLIVVYVSRRDSDRQHAPFASEPLEPRVAPDLVVARGDGARLSLARLAGKPVLVHFWATWCPPCRAELPGLFATASAIEKSLPFELLAVSVDDDWEQLRTFFADNVPRSVVRPEVADVHRRFGASALPDSYLVDAAGRIVGRYAGARDWSTDAARVALTDAVRRAAQ